MKNQTRYRNARQSNKKRIQRKATRRSLEEESTIGAHSVSPANRYSDGDSERALNYKAFPSAHRQMVAAEIGIQKGNQRLQRTLIQREDDNGGFQLRTPTALALPEFGGPSLGVGDLELDTSQFEGLPIQNAFQPERILTPSSAMLQELVNQWVQEYRPLHPGTAPAQSVWQQLIAAWNELAQQALTDNPNSFTDPATAQAELQDKAIESLTRIFAGQETQESASAMDVLGEIASPIGEALLKAFEKTNFFNGVKENAITLGEEHWPALIPILGGAFSTVIGQAIGDADWRSVSLVTNQLLPKLSEMLNLSFDLDDELSLGFQFQNSESIEGITESGVVIGLNPAVVIKYRGYEFFGSASMRFETGQNGVSGFQFHLLPGVGVRGTF